MMQVNDYRRRRLVLRVERVERERLPPKVVAERVNEDRAKSA
jgi:hypothetical protein